jgi:hypothetical protein
MIPTCPAGKTYSKNENACVVTAGPADEEQAEDGNYKHKKKRKKH